MSCKEENTFPFWGFVKKFPALRYMKAPVFRVCQLYEKYYDGLEAGSFAFVIEKFAFYGWDFRVKEWKRIGISMEDIQISWNDILDKPEIPDAQIQSDWSQTDNQKKDYIKNKPAVVTEAPQDGKTYGRKDGEWIEIKSCECGTLPPPPAPALEINPAVLFFDDNTEESVAVTITGTDNKAYSILNLPSWLTVSNKTETGFTLTVAENPSEDLRDVDLTVRLDAYPEIQEGLLVTQAGSWLSVFIFDVVTNNPNENVERIVNLGAIESGQARFDYGDGTPVEIKTVPQSISIDRIDNTGKQITIGIGTDFGHVFPVAGIHTVTIKVRNGVNAFRFSTVPEGTTVDDWGATFLPNDYIRAIRRIKSDFLTSGYKLFAGCRRASFAPEFENLETPNMADFTFMYEGFGSYGSGDYGGFNTDDRLRLPLHIYDLISQEAKAQATSAMRTYYGSGFERIESHMLSFSANLLSVLEVFKSMRNVGANWTDKYGQPNNFNEMVVMSNDIIDSTIFQAHPNINDFEGAFNAINDTFGFLTSGYEFRFVLRADLFKNNVANEINLKWTFNKFTKAIIESNFFKYLGNGQRIKYMDGCFYNFARGGIRFGGGDYAPSAYWGARIDQHPDSLFPDAEYENMTSMVGAFGYYGDSWSGIQRHTDWGFNGLWVGQNWGETVYVDSNELTMPSINIAQFLTRFPNVKPDSGFDPQYSNVCDGAAYNFGDWDVPDGNNVTRANDVNSYNARPQVKELRSLN